MTTETIVIPETFIGPPTIAHGGYVAGLLASRIAGAAQVTLRQPTPPGIELTLVSTPERVELVRDGDVLVDAVPSELVIDVPTPPSLDQARSAEAGSPSRWNERGVHPTCLGCGLARRDRDGLEVAVGPLVVDGVEQVAAVWEPRPEHLSDDGTVDPHWILAALDCPGAMAFIARETPAGLLGRIVFEQYGPAVPAGPFVVSGWQIDRDGRKLFAGTALSDAAGTVVAAARATWFGRG